MKVKELVKQPDGSYKEQYVDKGPASAKPNHGGGLLRKGKIFNVIGRA